MSYDFAVFNQRRLIKQVAQRWRAQYPNDKDGVQPKLDALDLNACSAQEVAKIIGNDSWTSMGGLGSLRLQASAFKAQNLSL